MTPTPPASSSPWILRRLASLHATAWPEPRPEWELHVPEMEAVGAILRAARALRTRRKLSQGRTLEAVVIDLDGAGSAAAIRALEASILAAVRAEEVRWGPAATETELAGVRLDLVP